MEPKAYCDLELVYDHVVFHVHKAILFKESVWFQTLLEGDPSVKRVELDDVDCLDRESIAADEFKGFLEYVYSSKDVQYDEVIQVVADEEEPIATEHKCGYYGLIRLSFHFNVPRIESRMKVLMRESNTESDPDDLSIFECLLYAYVYHWAQEEELLITEIAKHLLTKRKRPNFLKYWDPLPFALTEKILFAALEASVSLA